MAFGNKCPPYFYSKANVVSQLDKKQNWPEICEEL